MKHVYTVAGLLLLGGLGVSAAPPQHAATNSALSRVKIVCEPRYYVIGWHRGAELTMVRFPETNQVWEIYAIVLEVTAPAEHSGKLLTMHHDGVLASGFATNLYTIGKRYEVEVPVHSIGRLDFSECSATVPCKELGSAISVRPNKASAGNGAPAFGFYFAHLRCAVPEPGR